MGLETPLALLAIAAGALPWIAHRIRRRNTPTVRLPTFDFLLQATATRKRSRALSDLLLLAVRVALVLLVALALAKPYVLAEATLSGDHAGQIALVIDDSMSMGQSNGRKTLLDVAKQQALGTLEGLPPSSRVGLYLAGSPARVALAPTTNAAHIRSAIKAITPSARGTSLSKAIQLGVAGLRPDQPSERHLLVFSDGLDGANLDEAPIPDNVRLTFKPLKPTTVRGNVYFESLDMAPSASDPSSTTLNFVVAVTEPPPSRIQISVSGAGQPLTLPVPTQSGRHALSATVRTPTGADRAALRARIEADDALAADNQWPLPSGNTSTSRVLVVNGDPHPGSRDDELFYLRKALDLLPVRDGHPQVTTTDTASLVHEDLAGMDIVLLANVVAPTPAVAERLRRFVESGGGLIVSAGHHVRAQAYNNALGAIVAGHLQAAGSGVSLSLSPGGSDLPGLPALDTAGLANARTHSRLLVDSAATAPLVFSDGTPVVLERSVGKGTTLFVTTTLDDDWTDLPLRPGYIALVGALLSRAQGTPRRFQTVYQPGQTVTLPVPPGAVRLEVIAPSGQVTQWDTEGLAEVAFEQTTGIGNYTVQVTGLRGGIRDQAALAFRVMPSSDESRLQPSTRRPNTDGANTAPSSLGLTRKDMRPWIWLLAGLLALIETALRTGRRVNRVASQPPHGALRPSP